MVIICYHWVIVENIETLKFKDRQFRRLLNLIYTRTPWHHCLSHPNHSNSIKNIHFSLLQDASAPFPITNEQHHVPTVDRCTFWMTFGSLVDVLIEWQFVCLEPACEWQVMKCALPQKRRLPGNSILFSPLFPLHARRSVENFLGRFLCKVSLENVFYWFLLSLSGFSSVFVLILESAIAQTMFLNELLVTHRLHAAKINPNCDWTAFVAMNPRFSWVMKLLSGFHLESWVIFWNFLLISLFWLSTQIYVFHWQHRSRNYAK